MKEINPQNETPLTLSFYGGSYAVLIPFFIFISGVISLALSGAPDEKGFWPVLILALGIGLLLAKDKRAFSEQVIAGMSDKLVMVMISAWMLASILGVLMTQTGLVEALLWLASLWEMSGTGFVLVTFVLCCLVSLSTGSSFATILICSPLLYPAGGILGAHLPSLAGAILAGATFGDFIAPISDTTIASALSQKAEIGPTVKSRLKYIVPAFVVALLAFAYSASNGSGIEVSNDSQLEVDPKGLPMALVPVFILYLFLKGKHLLHGLLMGLLFGAVLGLLSGLLPLEQLISLDLDNFVAKSFVIDGINRAVGISFFTLLLMGLVATLKASGLVDKLVNYASRHSQGRLQSESWIAGTVATAVMLTTHSVVAVLMVAEFSNRTGESTGIAPERRANILSLVVCVFPFLLPYFIPVILMANMTQTGEEWGLPSLAPLEVGMHNFIAWAFAGITLIVLFLGWGAKKPKLQNPK